MATFKSDVKDYYKFKSGDIKPTTTRGLVVSTVDPLFAGRVKVWIPALHGPSPYGPIGSPDPDPTPVIPGVRQTANFKSTDVIAGLPWAKVVSQNSGPYLDLITNQTTSAGVFSTPKVGTEVILIFENNDPALPIIIGSIIHANEFRYSLARPFEYLPGILLTSIKQIDSTIDAATATPVDVGSYETSVAEIYNVRTGSGSTLFMSDDPTNRCIVLEGAIAFSERSTLTAIEEAQLSRIYPPFPTTATAAFATRQLLSTGTTSALLVPTAPNSIINSNNQTIVTDVNNQTANSEVIEKAKAVQAASDKVEKSLPISGSPRFSDGLGKFGAGPDGVLRKTPHVGIDMPANADGTTVLLAPIDCFPLYRTNITNVGLELLVLGVDGYGHGFLHLRSIYPNIAEIVDSKKGTLIKRGTPLGICGISMKTNHNTGPHLHWEVFDGGGSQSGFALQAQRNKCNHLAPIPSGMVNPLDWLKFSQGNNLTSIVQGTPEQIQRNIEWGALSSPSPDNNYAKPAGLEMSLTPGKETVTLRHPSGSFIGFDPDGNINIYSCGDINFRVNRSINYDVFGAIIESCFAKFTRAKTIIRGWAKIFNNGKTYTYNTSMPEVFNRMDQSRAIDMANALSSNLGNSFILDSNNNLLDPNNIGVNSTQDSGNSYSIQPVLSVYKDYTSTKWDSLLQDSYDKYIKVNATAARVFTDIKPFKAQMLQESNGNEKATGSAGDTGLFQLKPIAIQDVIGSSPSSIDMYQYYTASVNINMAFQYIVKLVEYVRIQLSQLGLKAEDVSATDYRYLVTISYNQGPIKTNKAIVQVKGNGQAITYKNVESYGIVSRKFSKPSLEYVPNIEYIRSKLS